jgi:thiosulfate reductase cytochrome b subunit
VVRVTHWLTFIAFVALVVTGGLIVISHPRFYWGEVGNVNTKPLFAIPIPSSRSTVPNGYSYEMPDENGWSRYLHFEAAWVLVLAGLVYGVWTGLAMSPSFTAAFPWTVELLGGRQSARTLHFFVTWLLLLFVFVHVAMVAMAGFWSRVRGMITGYRRDSEEVQ